MYPGFYLGSGSLVQFLFFVCVSPTHFHERKQEKKRIILLGWPYWVIPENIHTQPQMASIF